MFQTQAPIDAQTINLLIQLGAVGVLFLLAFGVVLWIWTHRNVKPVDTTSGTNDAITAMASITDKLSTQARDNQEWQRKSEEANRRLVAEVSARNVESVLAVSDATNRLADNLQTQTVLLNAINAQNQAQTSNVANMQTSLQTMTEVGSKPLQGVVTTTARIDTNTNVIIDKLGLLINGFEQLRGIMESALSNKIDLDDLKRRINQIEIEASNKVVEEAKHATGLSATVTVPEQELIVTAEGFPTP